MHATREERDLGDYEHSLHRGKYGQLSPFHSLTFVTKDFKSYLVLTFVLSPTQDML